MSTTSTEAIELEISGMTCASCANRIERKLNKLDGVTATINYATEKAKVTFPQGLAPEDLVRASSRPGTAPRCPGRRAPPKGVSRLRPTTPPGRSANGS